MKPQSQEKAKPATRRPAQGTWHQMNRKQRREMTRRIQSEDLSLAVIHPDAAGIDIGNESHYVAVPPTRDSQPVRRFGCTTAELKAMAVWLQQWAIRTIAMQSTGVYWVAVYDILEAAGFEVYLVNARETKNLPGRKSDVQGRKSRSSCRISQWFDSVATPNSQSSGSIVIRPEPWRRTLCPRRRARGEDRRPAKRTG